MGLECQKHCMLEHESETANNRVERIKLLLMFKPLDGDVIRGRETPVKERK